MTKEELIAKYNIKPAIHKALNTSELREIEKAVLKSIEAKMTRFCDIEIFTKLTRKQIKNAIYRLSTKGIIAYGEVGWFVVPERKLS